VSPRKSTGRRPERLSAFAAGALTLLLIAVVTYFGFTKSNPLADHFEVRAPFKSVIGLKKRMPVRVAGVEIGRVANVESLGNGEPGAMVTMRIRDRGQPLHRDATFKVRPRLFLEGNYFVDVTSGSPSAPELGDGDTVPVTQTSSAVSIGQFFEVLQGDTRDDLRAVLRELGRGLAGGGGSGYNRSIPHQAPAFKYSAIVNTATLGESGHDLSRYVASSGRVARALDRDPAALRSLVDDLATTFGAFAAEQRNLSSAVDELPRTLRSGERALGSLNSAFPPLRRFVRAYRPAVRSSGPALDAQLPLVRQLRRLVSRPELRGLVRDLRPTVPHLVELNRGGIALQEQSRLLGSCQVRIVLPWQQDRIPDALVPAVGNVLQEGVRWLPGIAGESRSFDANGQYIRTAAAGANYAYATGDGRFFLTGSPLQGVQPPKVPTTPPLRPDAPCETQERPDLASRVQAPPAAIRVNHDAPGARERLARAQRSAARWLRGNLRLNGLSDQLNVSPRLVTRDSLVKLGGRK
jgi:virulence factor Mce-like protein